MYTIDDFRPPHFHSRACPFCKVDLIKKPFTTVSTGCCFQCGRHVVELPEQKSEPVNTLAEMMQNCGDAYTWIKRCAYLLVSINLWYLLWFFVAFAFGNRIAWINKDLAIFAPVFLALAWFMFKFYLSVKRSYHCEHCRFGMSKQHETMLALTGRCPNCAQQIVKDLALPAEKEGTPRLNIDAYLKEWKALQRRLMVPLYWAGGWLFFITIFGVVIGEYLSPNFRDQLVIQFGAVTAEFLVFTCKALWMLISILPLARATIRFSKALSQEDRDEPGINCPSCSKTIFDSEISIATKRCHHCREVVFKVPEPMPAEGNGTAHVGLV